MILIVGGYASGKLDFALSLGYQPEEIHSLDYEIPLADLQKKPVVLWREMGCGLVPMDRDFAKQREVLGRLACDLAKEATAVYRMTCGIAQKLK